MSTWNPTRPTRASRLTLGVVVAAMLAAGCGGRGDEAPTAAATGSGEPSASAAETGPIMVGGSFPFSGPFAASGALSRGAQTYFAKVNADGGVGGRQIEYVVEDDGYDPARLAANARKLVEQDEVDVLMSFGGTNISIQPYLNQQQTFHMVLAGNTPFSNVEEFPYTHAWWPDIAWEGAITTEYVLENFPGKKLGLLGLNNDLSTSQQAGIEKAGGKLDKIITVAPGQADLSAQVNEMRSAGVEVLFFTIAGPGEIAALKYMKQVGYAPTIVMYSGASSRKAVITPAGLDTVTGVISAQWLKDPGDPKWADDADVVAYRADVAEFGAETSADAEDQLTLNGYGAAAALVEAITAAGSSEPDALNTAWGELKGIDNPALQPGSQLDAGPGGRLVYDYRLTRFDGTSWVDLGEVQDAAELGVAG